MKRVTNSPVLRIPKVLSSVLSANPRAKGAFQAMPPSHRREYIKHIMEAKQGRTRMRRAEKAAERMVLKGAGK